MKTFRKCGHYILFVVAVFFLVAGAVTSDVHTTIMGLLFACLFDNALTHKKLRELEATVIASGLVTAYTVIKGKPDGNAAD